MTSDFFRIDRGLVVDELGQITSRSGTPSSVDENTASIGSLFQQTDVATNSLNIWFKFQNTGTVADWVQLASKTYVDSTPSADANLILYSENPIGATPASALGANAVALGFGAEASAAKSVAIGEQSLTRIPGSIAIANGRFGTQGDAQLGTYLVRGTTPGNIPTELLVDGTGGSTRVVLPDDSTWTFKATVTGHQTSVGVGHAGFEVSGVIYRGSGPASTAVQGTVTVSVLGRSSLGWKATVVPDTVHGALKVLVTGETGKIVRWLAKIETVEVSN